MSLCTQLLAHIIEQYDLLWIMMTSRMQNSPNLMIGACYIRLFLHVLYGLKYEELTIANKAIRFGCGAGFEPGTPSAHGLQDNELASAWNKRSFSESRKT